MSVTPIFTGRVTEDGRLKADAPHDFGAHLCTLKGLPVEIVVRKRRSKRSLDQNAWHWGIAVPMIADALGYDKHEHEQVHYALVAKCFGTHSDPKSGLEIANVRSSRLSTKEFSELMEWEIRFAAELGIVVPLPNEVEAA